MTDRLNAGFHAAAIADVELPEPVAWGWWDTMIGKGHRLMMVRINHHDDGVAVPLYTADTVRALVAAAVAAERERCAAVCEKLEDKWQKEERIAP